MSYSREEVAKLFTPKDYAIVCREYSKNSPDMAVYEVNVDKFSDSLFTCLNLRSRMNPELTYFVTKRENLKKVIEFLNVDTRYAIPTDTSNLMVKI